MTAFNVIFDIAPEYLLVILPGKEFLSFFDAKMAG